jgi:uroporphyrinogen decarboxylase
MDSTLTSRERVRTVLARQQPDRVPVNYMANPGIDGRLKRHFGLADGDDEGLLRALRVDFRGIYAPYTGPRLHQDIPDRGVKVDDWGVHRRRVEHGSGEYWDFCDFPLKDATAEQIAAWPMPNPDHFDYRVVSELCRQAGDLALHVGNPGMGDVMNGSTFIRSMEQTLVDLVTDDPAGLLLARRRTDIQLEVARRTLDAAKGRIDFMWLGEDLGTQIGPMISLALYRRHIRPIHERFVNLAKSFNIPVMIHCCGSSSWAFDDFIAIGIGAVDTLQPEAKDMAPEIIKKRFGDRLAFHGCISTTGALTFGTPDDVRADCRHVMDVMMPGGGYAFSPTHMIQDNTPTENVLAAYETAWTVGTY